MQILPIKDLKDTVKIENLCTNENGPIYITKNGYGKLVVMNIEYYENLINQIEEAKLLNSGMEDIKNGKVIDGSTVMNELKKKYDL